MNSNKQLILQFLLRSSVGITTAIWELFHSFKYGLSDRISLEETFRGYREHNEHIELMGFLKQCDADYKLKSHFELKVGF